MHKLIWPGVISGRRGPIIMVFWPGGGGGGGG